jgi:hypothetical protein
MAAIFIPARPVEKEITNISQSQARELARTLRAHTV